MRAGSGSFQHPRMLPGSGLTTSGVSTFLGPWLWRLMALQPSTRRGRLLGGSWVVRGRVISPRIWVIAILILLITPLVTTHEPPSSKLGRV